MTFEPSGNCFNAIELNKIVHSLQNQSDKNSFTIDLSQYTHLGLFEVMSLLILLRHTKRNESINIDLNFSQRSSTIRFLSRWNWLKEIQEEKNDYHIRKITCGGVPLKEALRGISFYNRPKEDMSQRVMNIQRVNSIRGAIDYINTMYSNQMLSILYGAISKKPKDIRKLLDVIVSELLQNIVEHVLVCQTDESTESSSRTGFIAIQTYDADSIGRIGWEDYREKWPKCICDRLCNGKWTKGVVEISITDDGAGIKETLETASSVNKPKQFKDDLSAIKFACSEGASRFNCMSSDETKAEINQLGKKLCEEGLDLTPAAIGSMLTKLRNRIKNCQQRGYGLYRACEAISDWGGVVIVRSGDSYYCPQVPEYEKSGMNEAAGHLPGVQLQLLLPVKL